MAQMPVFNDFTARQGEIARRRKMAEMLQLEGMKPLEQQTAGGMVVPISPVQGLAKMLQAYVGAKGLQNAAAQDQAVAAERNKALVEALQSGPKTTVTTVGATPIDDEGNPNTHIQAPTDGDRRTYMAKLLQIGPDAVAAGQSLMAMENQNAQTAEQRASRERERAQDRINQQDRDQAQIIARQEEGRTQREAAAAERQLQREWQERQERSRREWELRNRQGPAPTMLQTPEGPVLVDRAGRATPITDAAGQRIKPQPTSQPLVTAAYKAGLDEIKKDDADVRRAADIEEAAKRWLELNARTSTGPIAGRRPMSWDDDYQELKRIENFLASNNFKPGQGQISNFERELIKGAGPQTANNAETNARIARVMVGAMQTAKDRANFREWYLQNKGNLLGADKAWADYVEQNPRYKGDGRGGIVENKERTDWLQHFGGAQQPGTPAARKVVRRGTLNGRKVVQYDDGTTEYAD